MFATKRKVIMDELAVKEEEEEEEEEVVVVVVVVGRITFG